MPVMPRMDKKSKDIIFEIIQTPPNLRDLGKGKRKKKSTIVDSDKKDARLVFEETIRSR